MKYDVIENKLGVTDQIECGVIYIDFEKVNLTIFDDQFPAIYQRDHSVEPEYSAADDTGSCHQFEHGEVSRESGTTSRRPRYVDSYCPCVKYLEELPANA